MILRGAGLLLSLAAALGCGTSGTSRAPSPGTSGRPLRGSLDRKVITEVIREHHREVRACYEVAVVKQPDLAGRVLSQFTISGAGDVVAVALRDSTLGNPTVEECVCRRLWSWKFPKPQGGGNVDVVYPFNFFPGPVD
jgi:hypothetical protein